MKCVFCVVIFIPFYLLIVYIHLIKVCCLGKVSSHFENMFRKYVITLFIALILRHMYIKQVGIYLKHWIYEILFNSFDYDGQ